MKKELKYKIRRYIQDSRKWVSYLITLSFLRKQKIGKVAVFHVGRCGSTMLADLFSQHSKIHWDGKKISRWVADNPTKSMSEVVFKSYLKKRIRGRTENYYFLEIEEENLSHLLFSLEHLIQLLKDMNFEAIITIERNYLHSIASRVSAINSGQWHIRERKQRSSKKFSINLKQPLNNYPNADLNALLEQYSKFHNQVDSKSKEMDFKTLTIDYSIDIDPDPLKAYKKICKFIQVEDQKVKVRFVKTSEHSTVEQIENKEDLKRYLSNTHFAHLLEGLRSDAVAKAKAP